MNDAYGERIAPDTLRLQRLLPGPIERVWSYLTESDKRGQWLASGPMDLRVGGAMHLSFRHADLSAEPGKPPAKYQSMEHGAELGGRITVCEPPYRLGHTWGDDDDASDVLLELTPQGDQVLLTVTHSRLRDRNSMVSTASGWHTHVGILMDRLAGREPHNFWAMQTRLEADYAQRLSAADTRA